LRPTPFSLHRFRRDSAGLLFPAPPSDLTPMAAPLCELPFSSKLYIYPTTAPARARRVHLSWGSLSLQRSTAPGVRMSQRFHPPAPFVLGVSHPLDDLLRPKPCQALKFPGSLATTVKRPNCALGIPPDLINSHRPFDRCRADAPGLPLHGVLLSRDGHVFACPSVLQPPGSLLRAFSRARMRFSFVCCTVLIAEESVFPSIANREYQPS